MKVSHKVFIVFVWIFLADSGKLLGIVVCFLTFVPSLVGALHVLPPPPLGVLSFVYNFIRIIELKNILHGYVLALSVMMTLYFSFSKFRWVLYTIRDLGSCSTCVCIFRHFFSYQAYWRFDLVTEWWLWISIHKKYSIRSSCTYFSISVRLLRCHKSTSRFWIISSTR